MSPAVRLPEAKSSGHVINVYVREDRTVQVESTCQVGGDRFDDSRRRIDQLLERDDCSAAVRAALVWAHRVVRCWVIRLGGKKSPQVGNLESKAPLSCVTEVLRREVSGDRG